MVDNEFEGWKREIIENAIHPQLDKLLDLQKLIEQSESYEEISAALEEGGKNVLKTIPAPRGRDAK